MVEMPLPQTEHGRALQGNANSAAMPCRQFRGAKSPPAR
jgi:hypothetical protein